MRNALSGVQRTVTDFWMVNPAAKATQLAAHQLNRGPEADLQVTL